MVLAVEALLADDTQSSARSASGSGADVHGRNMSNLDRMYLLNRLTIMPAAIGSTIETAMIAFFFYFSDVKRADRRRRKRADGGADRRGQRTLL